MKLSLKTFLQTGHLGILQHGTSQDEVNALLGPPDITGGTSRRYPKPSIWVYGTIELWFRQQAPFDLIGIWWEAANRKSVFFTPACVILDWAFTDGWTFAQVEDYLHLHDVTFDYRELHLRGDSMPEILTCGGVTIYFNEGLLYGIVSQVRD